MNKNDLTVDIRHQKGKQFSKKLRCEGKIPAILYARGKEPVMLICNIRSLKTINLEAIHVINLKMNGKTVQGIVREIQRDPVTDEILHIDFMGVDIHEKIEVEIPIVLTGIPEDSKVYGAVLEHITRSVLIECLPTDIPHQIEIDTTKLKIGHSLHISDIQLEGVTIRSNEDLVIASLVPPTVPKEEKEIEKPEETEEPEIIEKEKKKEEEKE